jgi:hypothetical protein
MLRDNTLLSVSHAFPTNCVIYVVSRTDFANVNFLYKPTFTFSDVVPHPTKDLAILTHSRLGSAKDITNLFAATLASPNYFQSHSVIYPGVGKEIRREVKKMATRENLNCATLTITQPFYAVDTVVDQGSCGSPLWRVGDGAACITGILSMKQMNRSYYVPISVNDFAMMSPIGASGSVRAHYKHRISSPFWANGIFPNTLIPLHENSALKYCKFEVQPIIRGTLTGFRSKPISKVVQTPLYKEVAVLFPGVEDFRRPRFTTQVIDGTFDNYNSPKQFNLRALTSKKATIPADLRAAAVVSYREKTQGIELLYKGPLSLEHAISGIDGTHFRSANMQTSFGYPYDKPKCAVLDDTPSTPFRERYTFTREQNNVYNQLIDLWADNKSIMLPFVCHYKDEPITSAKYMVGKLRVFAASTFYLTVAIRQFFGDAMIVYDDPKHTRRTECAIGINTYSSSWNEIYTFLAEHGAKNAIDADFKGYDKGISAEDVYMAFMVLIDFAARSGKYTPRDLRIMRSLMFEVCLPTYNFFGDLMQVDGTNPSGQALTAIINCIINSIYQRCFFYKIMGVAPSLPQTTAHYSPKAYVCMFNKMMGIVTYGDDSLQTTRLKQINMVTLIAAAASFNIVLTPAVKGSKPSTTKRHLQDVDFLKRGFYPVSFQNPKGETIFTMADPIALMSIAKMVAWRSAGIPNAEYFTSCVESIRLERLRQPPLESKKLTALLDVIIGWFEAQNYHVHIERIMSQPLSLGDAYL